MPTPLEILRKDAEPLPEWLANYQPGDPFPFKAFFASRVVYYPCSGTDGNPLRLFSVAHAAHCYIYVDNDNRFLDTVRHELEGNSRPAGYVPLAYEEFTENDLLPKGWTRTLPLSEYRQKVPPPVGLCVILQRQIAFDDSHGPNRLCILHLRWDAVSAFDALFCQANSKLPYAAILEPNYGFSTQEVSLFHALAVATQKTPPKWLVVADFYEPWPNYTFRALAREGGPAIRNLYERNRRYRRER